MGCTSSSPKQLPVAHGFIIGHQSGCQECTLESVGNALAEDNPRHALYLLPLVSPEERDTASFHNVAICTVTAEIVRAPDSVEEVKDVAMGIGLYLCDPAFDDAWKAVVRQAALELRKVGPVELDTAVSLLLAVPAMRRQSLAEDYFPVAKLAVSSADGSADLAAALGLVVAAATPPPTATTREQLQGSVWLHPFDGDCCSPDSMWSRYPPEWTQAVEDSFEMFLRGKGDRRIKVLERYIVDFALLTCTESCAPTRKAGSPSQVIPIRRLMNGRQTNPPPGRPHPWYVKCVEHRESSDWLNNEFFFRAFAQAMTGAGHEVKASVHEIFDFRFNQDFRAKTPEKDTTYLRGGVEYQEPFGWKKFAVRVKDRYGTDNRWLSLDGSAGEWAVAYHGTSFETVPLILNGGLRVGGRQAYKDHRDVRTGQTIGSGIYCTPSVKAAAEFAPTAQIEGHRIRYVFQCRVRPEAIKRVHDEVGRESGAYWVINNPLDIRPYGVLVQEVL